MKVCKGGPFLQFHETEADSESSEKLIGHWSSQFVHSGYWLATKPT